MTADTTREVTTRVVIPSLVGDISHLASMCGAAANSGAAAIVVANSSTLCQQLGLTSIPHVTSGRNEGFAASVALGADGQWSWLVILNDDLEFDPDDLSSCISPAHLANFDSASIIHFDNENPRKIPTPAGVALSVSLLSNVWRKLPLSGFRRRTPAANTYRSFSAVAIGRAAWERTGGLDTRFPFAYEDADFVRRALAQGVRVIAMHTSLVHLHSQTGGRFVSVVLPVATWSALEYLDKWYGHRTLHRWLLIFALCVRVPLAVSTSTHPARQLKAVVNAIRTLLTNEQPSLPEWDTV